MHERIRNDPSCVALLRSLFAKLASVRAWALALRGPVTSTNDDHLASLPRDPQVLDTPLTRIAQANSDDMQSVAQYYSGALPPMVDVLFCALRKFVRPRRLDNTVVTHSLTHATSSPPARR